MMYSSLLTLLLLTTGILFVLGRTKAYSVSRESGGISSLHSLPNHYGTMCALACAIPGFILYVIWSFMETSIISHIILGHLPEEFSKLTTNELTLVLNDIKNIANGDIASASITSAIQNSAENFIDLRQKSRSLVSSLIIFTVTFSGYLTLKKITPELRARNIVESIVKSFLILCSAMAIFTTIGIVLSVLFEAIRFFKIIPIQDFIFGLDWSPQTAIRADQAGSSGAFGAIPIFTGTIMIAGIAMAVAIPIGLLSAIYLSEYASSKVRTIAKPALEILAGIPTVVYGFFAALTVAPIIKNAGAAAGIAVSSESALAAGLVMGIMIIPFVSSLSDDVIHSVPQTLRDGSYGLGATKYETIKLVVIPAALPGIVGSILLAVSRAIGETMIVVMAAGLAANLTANPLKAVTTVTVQIVTLLVGDQEFDSPKTLAAFALGLLLFIFTLCLNIIALRVVRKYREQYE